MNEEKRQRRQVQLAKKAATIKKYASTVERKDDENLLIDGHPYRLVKNYRDGFQVEQLEESFSEILLKYDYVVGDWAYEQLRLHGFYKPRPNVHLTPLQNIEYLADYLTEYCNFGCAYFVLANQKVPPVKLQPKKNNKQKKRRQAGQKQKAAAKKAPSKRNGKRREKPAKQKQQKKKNNNQPHTQTKKQTKTQAKKRRFTVRKRK